MKNQFRCSGRRRPGLEYELSGLVAVHGEVEQDLLRPADEDRRSDDPTVNTEAEKNLIWKKN